MCQQMSIICIQKNKIKLTGSQILLRIFKVSIDLSEILQH